MPLKRSQERVHSGDLNAFGDSWAADQLLARKGWSDEVGELHQKDIKIVASVEASVSSPGVRRVLLIVDCIEFYITPLKTNMEHNHGGLEDHFPFQMGDL